MQYTELTPRTLGRMKKLMSLVVNASVTEPITSLNGDGNLPYTFSPSGLAMQSGVQEMRK